MLIQKADRNVIIAILPEAAQKKRLFNAFGGAMLQMTLVEALVISSPLPFGTVSLRTMISSSNKSNLFELEFRFLLRRVSGRNPLSIYDQVITISPIQGVA